MEAAGWNAFTAVTNSSTESNSDSRFNSDASVAAMNAPRAKNRMLVFTFRWCVRLYQGPGCFVTRRVIEFSKGLESPRSCRAKISCRQEQLSPERRVISHDRLRRNSRDKGGRGPSLFLTRLCPDPNNGAQKERLCEISGGL